MGELIVLMGGALAAFVLLASGSLMMLQSNAILGAAVVLLGFITVVASIFLAERGTGDDE